MHKIYYHIYMKISKLILLITLPLITNLAFGADCSYEVVGISGNNNSFDNYNFNQYVRQKKACAKVFPNGDIVKTVNYINSLNHPYEIYTYNNGADKVKDILDSNLKNNPTNIVNSGVVSKS